jgi:hypothetical protein
LFNFFLNKPYKFYNFNFICLFKGLIAKEYGTPLTPLYFERYQFEVILDALKEENLDCEALEKYFKLNINNLSNRYELIS